MSSETSPDRIVTSACGEAEICAGCSVASFILLGLCGFFAVVGRLGVWRLPVFFVLAAARESGDV